MGFCGQWVHWVMECVSSVSFYICANGEVRTKVHPGRGLRQGDPLSPYLFLIVKDVLSKLIQEAISQGNPEGLKFNRQCPPLSHIFFADDALLFMKAELKYCSLIKDILQVYGNASGQLINFEKSGFVFSSNRTPIEKQPFCDYMGIHK